MALSRSALIPATSPTSTDLFVGQASRLCPLGSAVTSPPAGWVGGYPRAPACHGVL
jgi:hypothetical protein